MKEIITWLRSVEHLASEVYQQAATLYAHDPAFSKFLEHIAEEEAWHYHVMGSAATFLDDNQDFSPAISIDEETSSRILNYFLDMKKGLDDRSLSQKELLERIVEAELSEWNDIFFYVVSSLTAMTGEFKYPAARIQSHIKGIENYVERIENMAAVTKKIKRLKPVWVEKILIVEDNIMVAELVRALLNRDGDIDIAHNGEEGMKMIKNKYYKLVISDIDMPRMNGIELYEKAVAKFPKLSSRFIFMSGDISADREAFFARNTVNCLAKPFRIKELRELSLNILLSN